MQSQSPVVPLEARWPPRIAVGMNEGWQFPAFSVEARRDGWVVVTVLATPTMRMLVEPAEIRAWTRSARAELAAPASSRTSYKHLPELGQGGYQFDVALQGDPSTAVHFAFVNCSPGSSAWDPSRKAFAEFLDLLDSAAVLAGGGQGRPPTLARPYYAREVSCPADPKLDNAILTFPVDVPIVERRLTEIGVRFVVDTVGDVEEGSIAILPRTDPRLARAAERIIAKWHFRAAEWNGTPIRQVVQQAVVIDPAPEPIDTGSHPISLRAELDGWVRFRHTTTFRKATITTEWFTPDSVEAWVARVDALYAEGDALDRETPRVLQKLAALGTPLGIQYRSGFFAHGKAVERRAELIACGGALTEFEHAPDSARLAQFRAVAREARALRATPADNAQTLHTGADVSCPARLPARFSKLPGFTRAWQSPTGIYPAAMLATQARAEVLASFVVDTAGIADVATIDVMPGSDPRAVEAVAASVRAFRYRPATRGGVKVSQRVIQNILFEPPPVCAAPTLGPACAGAYTDP